MRFFLKVGFGQFHLVIVWLPEGALIIKPSIPENRVQTHNYQSLQVGQYLKDIHPIPRFDMGSLLAESSPVLNIPFFKAMYQVHQAGRERITGHCGQSAIPGFPCLDS